MMEYLAYAAVAYLALRLLVILVNQFSGTEMTISPGSSSKTVSVLIPARNEEENIGRLLDDLSASDYPHLRIFVYDDESEDRTADIVIEKSRMDDRIILIRGRIPGPGWLGKNNGCARLAEAAEGDYFLFIDADVRVSKTLINSAVQSMEQHQLALLSIFPVQMMNSTGEWLTVPLVNRILVANLPLCLVNRSYIQAFSAANGQFMMFKADVYRLHRFHERFRDEKVEDIRIIRFMKSLRLPVRTLLSDGQIKCRMYRGFGDSMNGFAKNIHAFFGRNWLILFVYVILTTTGPFATWNTFGFTGLIFYLAGLILFSILVSLQSKQPVWRNLLLMPFQQVTIVMIAFLAAFRHSTGTLKWKGRRV
ncbi:MAG: glycosyltransferase family 2 protein [Bacteroidales bacterium]|nr:glycosyltransferase family 2 protein [Bacteroidales bacterium]